jgi:murein endopeptidase
VQTPAPEAPKPATPTTKPVPVTPAPQGKDPAPPNNKPAPPFTPVAKPQQTPAPTEPVDSEPVDTAPTTTSSEVPSNPDQLRVDMSPFRWLEPIWGGGTDTSLLKQITQLFTPSFDGGGHAINLPFRAREKGVVLVGKLQSAHLLASKGDGYQLKYPQRHTSFGSGFSLSILTRLSALFRANMYADSTILVGDIARERGGVFSPHDSHQNGQDMDLNYLFPNGAKEVPFPHGKLNPNWDIERNFRYWRLLISQQMLAKDQKPSTIVNRIFVNAKIKSAVCAWAKSNVDLKDPLNVETLRRLDPIAGHLDHFHVRFFCSPAHFDCRNQQEPAPGTHCH